MAMSIKRSRATRVAVPGERQTARQVLQDMRATVINQAKEKHRRDTDRRDRVIALDFANQPQNAATEEMVLARAAAYLKFLQAKL